MHVCRSLRNEFAVTLTLATVISSSPRDHPCPAGRRADEAVSSTHRNRRENSSGSPNSAQSLIITVERPPNVPFGDASSSLASPNESSVNEVPSHLDRNVDPRNREPCQVPSLAGIATKRHPERSHSGVHLRAGRLWRTDDGLPYRTMHAPPHRLRSRHPGFGASTLDKVFPWLRPDASSCASTIPCIGPHHSRHFTSRAHGITASATTRKPPNIHQGAFARRKSRATCTVPSSAAFFHCSTNVALGARSAISREVVSGW